MIISSSRIAEICIAIIFLIGINACNGKPVEKTFNLQVKWINATVICPGKDNVSGILLLNPKGYQPIYYLKYDDKLLNHLQSTNKNLVELISKNIGTIKNRQAMSLVSLAGYKIDNSWFLPQATKGCLIDEIEGHK